MRNVLFTKHFHTDIVKCQCNNDGLQFGLVEETHKSNFKNVAKNDKINNTRVNMPFTFEGAVLPLSGMETMGSSTKTTVALYLGLPTNPCLIICDHLPQETWGPCKHNSFPASLSRQRANFIAIQTYSAHFSSCCELNQMKFPNTSPTSWTAILPFSGTRSLTQSTFSCFAP